MYNHSAVNWCMTTTLSIILWGAWTLRCQIPVSKALELRRDLTLFSSIATHLLVQPSFLLFPTLCSVPAAEVYVYSSLGSTFRENGGKWYCRNYKWFQKDSNTCHRVFWLKIYVEPECHLVDLHGSTEAAEMVPVHANGGSRANIFVGN